MSNPSQVIAHVRDCRNRCTSCECKAQPVRGRDSGPTVAPRRVCQSGTTLPNMLRYFRPETTNLGLREQPQSMTEFVPVTHCPRTMNHQLKTTEFELLCNMMADIETFIELSDRLQRSDERFVRSIREVGVPFTPSSWKRGNITAAQKMAYTRAVRRLERSGFITRISESKRDRTTHVRPTKMAVVFMIDQLGPQIDCDQLFESISRMHWCGNLVGKPQRLVGIKKGEGKTDVE